MNFKELLMSVQFNGRKLGTPSVFDGNRQTMQREPSAPLQLDVGDHGRLGMDH